VNVVYLDLGVEVPGGQETGLCLEKSRRFTSAVVAGRRRRRRVELPGQLPVPAPSEHDPTGHLSAGDGSPRLRGTLRQELRLGRRL